MVLGDPPTTLKPPSCRAASLRRVYDGAALIEGRDGIIEVEPGIVAPGLGRIEAIKRQDGRWVVVTARGADRSALIRLNRGPENPLRPERVFAIAWAAGLFGCAQWSDRCASPPICVPVPLVPLTPALAQGAAPR